eukprot:CAMPEP_0202385210 /NCGR_PEP_ID=MMETSP1127-20130417/59407_1 /ASSEMBLY_ACC=CAM_ASM_000462 /TAXON_ID=3047 /ORGANISM="Dunaliella tertiolecta, Strain CCMP1320" /LENGTH=174 /DNA_ID=CAMNT_0048985275 /DNA_START=1804 /DNA_END=2325 /DNA_ORIENTATION=-
MMRQHVKLSHRLRAADFDLADGPQDCIQVFERKVVPPPPRHTPQQSEHAHLKCLQRMRSLGQACYARRALTKQVIVAQALRQQEEQAVVGLAKLAVHIEHLQNQGNICTPCHWLFWSLIAIRHQSDPGGRGACVQLLRRLSYMLVQTAAQSRRGDMQTLLWTMRAWAVRAKGRW